jgi:hypothetical protein
MNNSKRNNRRQSYNQTERASVNYSLLYGTGKVNQENGKVYIGVITHIRPL